MVPSRSGKPSLRLTLYRCRSTVDLAIDTRSAICLLESPAATRSQISSSRTLSRRRGSANPESPRDRAVSSSRRMRASSLNASSSSGDAPAAGAGDSTVRASRAIRGKTRSLMRSRIDVRMLCFSSSMRDSSSESTVFLFSSEVLYARSRSSASSRSAATARMVVADAQRERSRAENSTVGCASSYEAANLHIVRSPAIDSIQALVAGASASFGHDAASVPTETETNTREGSPMARENRAAVPSAACLADRFGRDRRAASS